MKGTYSMGKRSKGKSHIICRRCGRHSYHTRKKKCASCGFAGGNRPGSAKVRKYNWQNS